MAGSRFAFAPDRPNNEAMNRVRPLVVGLSIMLLGAVTTQTVRAESETPTARSQQAAQAGRLRNFERALNGVRFRYFDAPDRDGRRTIGIARLERLLRAEPDPRKYSIAWDAFARVHEADRAAIIDAFALTDTDAGWTMLGWLAVFEDGPLGDRALALLGAHRDRVRWLVGLTEIAENAILSEHPLHAQRGSLIVEAVGLVDVVPAMIVGQIWPPNARSAEEGLTDRIYLRQTRPPPAQFNDFLARNRPMRLHSLEAEYAGSGVIQVQRRHVARNMPRDFSQPRFDGQPVFHRGGTHESLVRMTTSAWGRPTDHLGWDVAQWQRWYIEEFQPLMIQRRRTDPGALPLWPTP